MPRLPVPARISSGGALAVGVACLLAAASAEAQPRWARQDPEQLVTAEACGECHVHELEVWKRTPHASGFRSLHRKATAEEIAGRMGYRLIKRDSVCIRCHYSPRVDDGEIRAAAGVSCESCHGAGRDWIDVHNRYGEGFTRDTEPPAHRQERIARSRAAGMRRPSDVYELAASCFGCHTVPEEELVNVGGHSTGSASFELVAWTQGEIRHNFLGSLTGGGTDNRESPVSRRRMLYVCGRALDLEHSLRGMAAATKEGIYAKAMARRVRSALLEIRAIARSGDLPEVERMLAEVRGVRVAPGNAQRLSAAADAIGELTRRLLAAHDGEQLASLDPLLAGEELPEADEEAETVVAGGTPPPGGTTGPSAPPPPAGAARPPSGGVPAVGEVRRHIRPRSSFATIGPSHCGRCHAPHNEWWFHDPHFRAADRFLEQDPKVVKIARLYGLDPRRAVRGDALCMDCHGTVIAGKERREVLDGVSCESCHGPAEQYLEPHQEGDKSAGRQRPGYLAALGLGMVELADLDVRAATCAGCHYVTDPRLLSSGHPSGTAYDFAAGMVKIKHWERGLAPAERLSAAYRGALSRRGPIPEVRLARLGSGAAGSSAGGAVAASGESEPRLIRPPPPRPLGRAPPTAGPLVPIELPPFPEVDESTPIEEILLLVKRRLELLYRAVGRP